MKKILFFVLTNMVFSAFSSEVCEKRKSPRVDSFPRFIFNAEYFSDDMEEVRRDAVNRRNINNEIAAVESRLLKAKINAVGQVAQLDDDVFSTIVIVRRIESVGFCYTPTKRIKEELRTLEEEVAYMDMEELESKKHEVMQRLSEIEYAFKRGR